MRSTKFPLVIILVVLLVMLFAPSALAQTFLSSGESQLVASVNQARKAAGLTALTVNPVLCDLADIHAQDMVDKHYLGYRSPTFGSVFTLVNQRRVSYARGGESIVRLSSAASVTRAWSQPTALAMRSYFNQIGVGVCGNIYVAILIQSPSGSGTVTPTTPTAPTTPTTPTTPATAANGDLTDDEARMLVLVNKERAAVGLRPLTLDQQLVKLARLKAADMVRLGYFDHTSPTYGSPFDMMKKYGVTYRYAGENLAGSSKVDFAHTNLMNSPGHRANILSPNFSRVGIGVVSGSRYGKIWVQMFTG